jgi:hypothetical protein
MQVFFCHRHTVQSAAKNCRGGVVLFDTATSTQLPQVIAQATAPAFLLGAVAAFISVLISRMNRITDNRKR